MHIWKLFNFYFISTYPQIDSSEINSSNNRQSIPILKLSRKNFTIPSSSQSKLHFISIFIHDPNERCNLTLFEECKLKGARLVLY